MSSSHSRSLVTRDLGAEPCIQETVGLLRVMFSLYNTTSLNTTHTSHHLPAPSHPPLHHSTLTQSLSTLPAYPSVVQHQGYSRCHLPLCTARLAHPLSHISRFLQRLALPPCPYHVLVHPGSLFSSSPKHFRLAHPHSYYLL